MNATYVGGNIARLTVTAVHDGNTLEQANVYLTMTQLRDIMTALEAEYREKSCCPSCGTLTYGEGTCSDCKRYEATRDCCEHGVPVSEGYCVYCHAKDSGILCTHGVELDTYCAACDREN